ncbi:hypothetical protein [Anaerofustis stercorihominis]|uniref:Uncharacterized protein n=1 Tax=Anaerofustis stercorihominis TaxID=214853 RepID=A0A3E3DUM5_9FIRM|nr:hypothetical protein [Anaerofustis stercorihominis]RGD72931.1 hypothetical protein DW687_11870 [Anaerofustis stercorihominis]
MFMHVESPNGDYKWLLNTDNIVFIDIHNKEIALVNGRCLEIRSIDFCKIMKLLTRRRKHA